MEIDIQKILQIVQKKWKVFVACGLIGVIVAFLFASYGVAPKYTSKVSFLAYVKNDTVEVNDSTGGAASANTKSTYTIKMIPTYITLLQTDDFYNNLKTASGVDMTIGQLKSAITYQQTQDTTIFSVSVTTGDADASKKIADYISEAAPKAIQESNDNDVTTVKVIDPATKGLAQKANVVMYAAVGLILGLALAFAYALIRDMLDVHFKTEEDVTSRYNIPLLGSIPDFESASSRKAGGR